ncbi:MAG: hypothetical protein WCJ30_08180 [Deltaproteobacteria bacterium]
MAAVGLAAGGVMFGVFGSMAIVGGPHDVTTPARDRAQVSTRRQWALWGSTTSGTGGLAGIAGMF